jgi:hypothetical protein
VMESSIEIKGFLLDFLVKVTKTYPHVWQSTTALLKQIIHSKC